MKLDYGFNESDLILEPSSDEALTMTPCPFDWADAIRLLNEGWEHLPVEMHEESLERIFRHALALWLKMREVTDEDDIEHTKLFLACLDTAHIWETG
jgi:hypothetical protein